MSPEVLLNSLLVSDSNSLGLLEIMLAIVLPFLLGFPITKVYQKTQKSNNYSLAFIQSIFLFSCLSSVMTLIIGSNIARAFGLIGALSIIRFRNALKSPIDAVYIFWALAVGMACGTGYYMAAALIVALVSCFSLVLHYTGYGVSKLYENVIRVYVELGQEDKVVPQLEKQLAAASYEYRQVNVIQSTDGRKQAFVYLVRGDKPMGRDMLGQLEKLSGVGEIRHAATSASVFAA